jgi:Xaa-Pro dipeptidase
VFYDNEEHRDRAVRYFTGHPMDALLVITAAGRGMLVPWDVQMAGKMAPGVTTTLSVTPLTKFNMDAAAALKEVLPALGVVPGSRVDLAPYTSYPDYGNFSEKLEGYELLCRAKGGAHQEVITMRAVKDSTELAAIREAGRIACAIADLIEERVRDRTRTSETVVALLIEAQSRAMGAEGTSFDTLAAGPERSFGIHCFPNYTASPFGKVSGGGMSILDFGVCYQGYRSDITVTFLAPPLSSAQERLVALVDVAYHAALPLYRAGLRVREAAGAAAAVFSRDQRAMPHGLGHGVGLDIHEYPRVNVYATEETRFLADMVVTLEPGLYDTAFGGCRWENDILITTDSPEVLTRSRIVRL